MCMSVCPHPPTWSHKKCFIETVVPILIGLFLSEQDQCNVSRSTCSHFITAGYLIAKLLLFALQLKYFRWWSVLKVIMGNSMVNGPKKKISLKRHFLMVLVYIRYHFIIETLQKYLYKVVSKTKFFGHKSLFWPTLQL